MGQYLHIGICRSLRISKIGEWKKYTKDDLLLELSKNINVKLYEVIEFEDHICLEINQDVVTANVKSLLTEQLELLNEKSDNKDKLLELLDCEDYDELLNLSELNKYYNWHSIQNFNYSLCGDLRHRVDYKLFGYYFVGKAYMECYNDFFNFIQRLVRKTSDNPLKDTIIVGLE